MSVYKKHPSTAVKREWLKLYYEKNASVRAIADDYGYPIHTVYRVLRNMSPHKKERKDKGKEHKSPTIDIDFDALAVQGESHETQIELFIQEILRSISSAKGVKVSNALSYANQLMNALKKLRSIQFSSMAKNLDVEIVEAIIRRYEPDASDMRVIEIFKEVAAEVKAKKDE